MGISLRTEAGDASQYSPEMIVDTRYGLLVSACVRALASSNQQQVVSINTLPSTARTDLLYSHSPTAPSPHQWLLPNFQMMTPNEPNHTPCTPWRHVLADLPTAICEDLHARRKAQDTSCHLQQENGSIVLDIPASRISHAVSHPLPPLSSTQAHNQPLK